VTDLAKPPSVSREGAPDIEHMHMRTAATGVAMETAGERQFNMFGET
jgi:hypothetical protein